MRTIVIYLSVWNYIQPSSEYMMTVPGMLSDVNWFWLPFKDIRYLRCWLVLSHTMAGPTIYRVYPAKRPYPPCLRMADRALLAGYRRYVLRSHLKCLQVDMHRWIYRRDDINPNNCAHCPQCLGFCCRWVFMDCHIIQGYFTGTGTIIEPEKQIYI